MRERYKPKGKFFAPALTFMRDTAYGMAAQVAIHKAVERAETMRNDQAMLDAAQAKRARKVARNKGEGK